MAMTAPTALGTAKSIPIATDTLYNRLPKLGYNSSSTKASFAGLYSKTGLLTVDRADGSGGGFQFVCRFGFSDTNKVTGTRAFIGLSSSVAAPSNVEPDTMVNSVGIAQLSGDATQLYLVYGGAAPQAAIGLSSVFPPSNSIPYELTLLGLSNTDGAIAYRLERLDTNAVTEGVLTPTTVGTQTPAETTLLAPRAWRCNNANTGVVGLDICQIYMESYV